MTDLEALAVQYYPRIHGAPAGLSTDDQAAALVQWLELRPRVAARIAWHYLGRGPGADPTVPADPGPGLAALVDLLADHATRRPGDPPLPAPPTREGYRVKPRPAHCPICGGRMWSATPKPPARPSDQPPTAGTAWLDPDGSDHTCPEDPPAPPDPPGPPDNPGRGRGRP